MDPITSPIDLIPLNIIQALELQQLLDHVAVGFDADAVRTRSVWLVALLEVC